jgi:uncharacterized membrane protein
MYLQALIVKGATTVYACWQNLIFMYLKCLLVVAEWISKYLARFERSPARISANNDGSAGTS